MELDSTLVQYMKKKAECAKLVACFLSVQCFVLAVSFCADGLLQEYLVYSDSIDLARKIIIISAIVIALVLCLVCTFVSIKCSETVKIKPDSIALRQSYDVVKTAYELARPQLIYKITCALLITFLSGLIYILLVIFLDRSMMSGVYGRIVVAICMALAIYIAYPCVDRLFAYRELLGEEYVSIKDEEKWKVCRYAISIALPGSISSWYILRFYTNSSDIAWIVFPMVALFAFAIVFLIMFVIDMKNKVSEK